MRVSTVRMLSLMWALGACTPAYLIEPAEPITGPAAVAPVVLFQMPSRPHRVIATFSGRETGRCPDDTSHCVLRERARHAGADAVVILRVLQYRYPGEWIVVQGRMTRLYPYEYDRIEGVFIRFIETSQK